MSVKYRGPIHKRCDRCGCDHPGQFVKFFHDEHTEALCFDCWHPLTWTGGIGVGQCKVLYWINKYGKDSFLPGGTSRP